MYLMYFKEFIICFVLLILIDAPYLFINASMYQSVVRKISGRGLTSRYYSAAIVYIALALGVSFLAVPRMRKGTNFANRLGDALLYGGIFGLAAYATFDFTIHFMLEDWTLGISIMDTIWGGILCSLVALVSSYII
jgi:uncharacterized membrane protein